MYLYKLFKICSWFKPWTVRFFLLVQTYFRFNFPIRESRAFLFLASW